MPFGLCTKGTENSRLDATGIMCKVKKLMTADINEINLLMLYGSNAVIHNLYFT
jgi:hypothetical protein